MRSNAFAWSLTNDGFHIFRIVCDIKEITSTKCIIQGLLKSSKVVENLWSNQGSEFSTPKRLILVQHLTMIKKKFTTHIWKGITFDLLLNVCVWNRKFNAFISGNKTQIILTIGMFMFTLLTIVVILTFYLLIQKSQPKSHSLLN